LWFHTINIVHEVHEYKPIFLYRTVLPFSNDLRLSNNRRSLPGLLRNDEMDESSVCDKDGDKNEGLGAGSYDFGAMAPSRRSPQTDQRLNIGLHGFIMTPPSQLDTAGRTPAPPR
jgi:hypothetical protein